MIVLSFFQLSPVYGSRLPIQDPAQQHQPVTSNTQTTAPSSQTVPSGSLDAATNRSSIHPLRVTEIGDGDSLAAAIESGAYDEIRILSGTHTLDSTTPLSAGMTLTGVADSAGKLPTLVISNPDHFLVSGATVQNLNLDFPPSNISRTLTIPSTASHVTLDRILVQGNVTVEGSNNQITNSQFEAGGASILNVTGGSNLLKNNIVLQRGFGSVLSVVTLHSIEGGNILDHNTILGKGFDDGVNPVMGSASHGIAVAQGIQTIETITNNIIAGTGLGTSQYEIYITGSTLKKTAVSYNFLGKGSGYLPPRVTGAGNLSFRNPSFVNAALGDYSLERDSQAKNAGDPAAPLDADGTRADMGAKTTQ